MLMKNTLILLFIGIIFLVLGQAAEACIKTSVLEDVSLPTQKQAEGYHNLMSIPEGMEAFCTTQPFRPDLFVEARLRLSAQDELLEQLIQDGTLKPNGARYYRGFLKDIRENLNTCEKEALKIRQRGSVPEQDKLVQLTIRPNDLIDLYYSNQVGGVPIKHIISHKIWFGRIIRQDGFDLCQTQLQ